MRVAALPVEWLRDPRDDGLKRAFTDDEYPDVALVTGAPGLGITGVSTSGQEMVVTLRRDGSDASPCPGNSGAPGERRAA